MSKIFSLFVIIFSLAAGFGGGWLYQITLGKQIISQSETKTKDTATDKTTPTGKSSSKAEQTLEECLTEVWGKDKYAAISANSSLATTEDNLTALKCYED